MHFVSRACARTELLSSRLVTGSVGILCFWAGVGEWRCWLSRLCSTFEKGSLLLSAPRPSFAICLFLECTLYCFFILCPSTKHWESRVTESSNSPIAPSGDSAAAEVCDSGSWVYCGIFTGAYFPKSVFEVFTLVSSKELSLENVSAIFWFSSLLLL